MVTSSAMKPTPPAPSTWSRSRPRTGQPVGTARNWGRGFGVQDPRVPLVGSGGAALNGPLGLTSTVRPSSLMGLSRPQVRPDEKPVHVPWSLLSSGLRCLDTSPGQAVRYVLSSLTRRDCGRVVRSHDRMPTEGSAPGPSQSLLPTSDQPPARDDSLQADNKTVADSKDQLRQEASNEPRSRSPT
jgi:hypothetical protein